MDPVGITQGNLLGNIWRAVALVSSVRRALVSNQEGANGFNLRYQRDHLFATSVTRVRFFCLVWFFFFPQKMTITIVVHPYAEGWCKTCVLWTHCFEPFLKLAFTSTGVVLVLVVGNGSFAAQRQALLGLGSDGMLLKRTTLTKPVRSGCCKLCGCRDVAGLSHVWELKVQFGSHQWEKMPSSPAKGSFSGLCNAALVSRKQ